VEKLDPESRFRSSDPGHTKPSPPLIQLERSATALSTDEPKEELQVVTGAKFDPRGKSVASGKNITGWI
jgi:hypothetical protein